MNRALASLLLAMLALQACSNPPPPVASGPGPAGQAKADAEARAACRERADAQFNRQNRGTIYSSQSVDAPFSAGTTNVITSGLPQRFAYNSAVRDCVRNTGAETDRSQGAPEGTPTQP